MIASLRLAFAFDQLDGRKACRRRAVPVWHLLYLIALHQMEQGTGHYPVGGMGASKAPFLGHPQSFSVNFPRDLFARGNVTNLTAVTVVTRHVTGP
jgi:hypothetical protein